MNLLRWRKNIRKMQSNCTPDRGKLRFEGDDFFYIYIFSGPAAFTLRMIPGQMNILGIYSIITYSLFYRVAIAKSSTKIKNNFLSYIVRIDVYFSIFIPITLGLDSMLYVTYDKIMNCTISNGFIQIYLYLGVGLILLWDGMKVK